MVIEGTLVSFNGTTSKVSVIFYLEIMATFFLELGSLTYAQTNYITAYMMRTSIRDFMVIMLHY